MKSRLQDYTESEFLQLLLASEELDFSDDDLDELVNFFNEKINHPKGSALLTHPTMLGIEDSSEAIIEELKRWYREKRTIMFQRPTDVMVKSITDYTEIEFLELLKIIISAEGSDGYQDELLENFIATTEHPDGSDLIYYPENPEDGTLENIVRIVKEWRLSQGLPCFKS